MSHQQGAQARIGSRLNAPFAKLTSILSVMLLFSAYSTPAIQVPASVGAPTPIATTASANVIPFFAYYYIWFSPTSWDSNKSDTPLLGHYSSGDPAIIRQHIRWAKAAGIDAFIVSWKNAPRLNGPLEQLIQIADQENFKLAINYEGLDNQRNPLPASQVAADLKYFEDHYAADAAFAVFEKPLVIWAGTWKFSPQDVASATAGRRDHLLIFGSERDVPGVQRLSGLVDGEAYYFSSVNPDTFPHYQEKLAAMAQAVHAQGGRWIAPAAPGFDSRLLAGTTVVDRKQGATLREEMNVALQSSPDAIGLISWNEFSENSHVEPSKTFGTKYLDMLSEINHMPSPGMPNTSNAPGVIDFDSSDPTGRFSEVLPNSRLLALGGVAVLVLSGLVMIWRRSSNTRN